MVRGKWTRSRVTIAQLKSAQEEGKDTPKPTCRYLRDEAVDGEPDAGVAGNSNGKSRSSMRYGYKNVQPPPGVK